MILIQAVRLREEGKAFGRATQSREAIQFEVARDGSLSSHEWKEMRNPFSDLWDLLSFVHLSHFEENLI